MKSRQNQLPTSVWQRRVTNSSGWCVEDGGKDRKTSPCTKYYVASHTRCQDDGAYDIRSVMTAASTSVDIQRTKIDDIPEMVGLSDMNMP